MNGGAWREQLLQHVSGDDDASFAAAFAYENGSPMVDKVLGLLGYNATSTGQRTIKLLADTLALQLASHDQSDQPSGCKCQSIAQELGECRLPECSCGQHILSEERISFGSAVPTTFLQRVLVCCKNIVEIGHGASMVNLIEALLKACTERCSFKQRTPASCSLYVLQREDDDVATRIVEFLDVLVQNSDVYHGLSSSSRLHAWRLHPMLLKQDMSDLVVRATRRPDFFVGKEFRQVPRWKKLVSSLASSPLAFGEARRLLHNWITHGCVWIVVFEVVEAVKMALIRPVEWGFTEESANDLQPFYTFYLSRHRQVVNALNGPLTTSGLEDVVSMLERLENSDDHSFTVSWNHHDSFWSLLVDFPQWYYLSLKMLFSSESGPQAAKYATLILAPFDRASRETCIQEVRKAAEGWQFIRRGMAVSATNGPTSAGPSSKRLKTASVEETPRATKSWLEENLGLFQGRKRNSVLLSIFSLGPVLADFKLLEHEIGRLLVETVVLQAREFPSRSPSFREPAHRTERFTGGGDVWISGIANFLIGSSSRIQESESDSESEAKQLVSEIVRQAESCGFGTTEAHNCWKNSGLY